MALQVVQPAHAHAQALRQAPLIVPVTPNVTVEKLDNGVPYLNTAPIPSGHNPISHNVFKTFNVGPEGLIINNSRVYGTTELSGGQRVPSNPNLGFGDVAATVINEVTGATRSDLLGITEMKGPPTDYILANPNGITCNGCGFINMPNVTLGAGQSEFDAGGKFLGLRMSDGTVRITGTGADATKTKVFELIAGKVMVDGPIHADRLKVTAGTGEAGTGYAIDSTALGGMHANSITLTATGDGVGVRVPPHVAAHSGTFSITAEGHINLAGDVVSKRVDAEGKTVEQTGTVRATDGQVALLGNEITVRGQVETVTDRVLLSGRDMQITEGAKVTGRTISVNSSRSKRDGVVTVDGTLHAQKTVSFKTYGDLRINETGVVSAGGRVKSIKVNNLTLDGQIRAADVWLN
ncbi:MAG: filamentous hemagglutinin N-terminal domain-containing protein, partial [Bacteroidetes bacterium]|nr:filamentous hemagglutinin N-terminal domain-containing protein [Bacteroidota bacterium]